MLSSFLHQQEENKVKNKILISMEKIKNPSNLDIQLPPGFRFHPTDEELIVHYLQKKVTQTTLPASIFAEIELYKFDPWELPYKALFGEDEWYFFSPRDRKYPNGVRPNRMAGSGYWKATGTDRPIMGSLGAKMVGVKKGLVFYKGRPPRGVKTDWIMHEYRLLDTVTCNSSKPKESMRLDDWVLCRVRQKTCSPRNFHEDYGQRVPEPKKSTTVSTVTNPNFEIFNENLFKDCPMLPFMFGSPLDFPSMDTLSSKEDNFESHVDSNKRLKTMESQNSQNEKVWSLGIDANDMSFYGGGLSDIWRIM
ncbi:hypothetical protein L2E82_05608 [Cichorium intybus]|uniref:Uncharacterized protein n=1 Tax=Cichorium intybus TaxID=13427 RepID=A0ACB9H8W0_CICIN|nr:hypothetical protein L2E82_05608 [Cichorium intybus]